MKQQNIYCLTTKRKINFTGYIIFLKEGVTYADKMAGV